MRPWEDPWVHRQHGSAGQQGRLLQNTMQAAFGLIIAVPHDTQRAPQMPACPPDENSTGAPQLARTTTCFLDLGWGTAGWATWWGLPA